MNKTLLMGVAFYRTYLSSYFGGCCRFYPSCSEYATEALQVHSLGKALLLILSRLFKCRPGGPCGFDPLPRSVR